jgi:CHAD domain-containing protein
MMKRSAAFSVSNQARFQHAIKELRNLGYRVIKLRPLKKRFAYFDTQSGKLFKEKKRLRFDRDSKVLELMQNGERLSVKKVSELQVFPEGKRAFSMERLLQGAIFVPHLDARAEFQRYRVIAPNEHSSLISVQKWAFSSPHRSAWKETREHILFTSDSSAQEVSYLRTIFHDLCGGRSVRFDPLTTGLSEIDAALPGAPVLPTFRLRKDDSILQAGIRILTRQAYKMRANTEGTALDLDQEYLHDLRVATRRARFALKMLKPFFAEDYCETLRKELSWIAGLLGNVRDIDVFSAHLRTHFERAQSPPDVRGLLTGLLQERRVRPLSDLKEALFLDRYEKIVSALESAAEYPLKGNASSNATACKHASQFIKKATKKVDKSTRRSVGEYTPTDLHSLRIAFKGLRYMCEFFSDLYSRKLLVLIKSIVAFQDCLGLYQDSEVSLSYLEELFQELLKREPERRDLVLSFGALFQVQREVQIRQLEIFGELWAHYPQLKESIAEITGIQ